MVLVSSGEDLFMSLAGEKGEGWTGESILPLKMMKQRMNWTPKIFVEYCSLKIF